MDLRDLVLALRGYDALSARQWVSDALRQQIEWEHLAAPTGLDATDLAIAAGVIELLAERTGKRSPEWTQTVAAAPKPIFLVRAAESMSNLRKQCQEEGPWPLRRRQIFAPTEFLQVA